RNCFRMRSIRARAPQTRNSVMARSTAIAWAPCDLRVGFVTCDARIGRWAFRPAYRQAIALHFDKAPAGAPAQEPAAARRTATNPAVADALAPCRPLPDADLCTSSGAERVAPHGRGYSIGGLTR